MFIHHCVEKACEGFVILVTKTETNSIVLLYIVFKQHCLGHSLTFALGNHALCHVAMVAKVLDENKPIKSPKSLFALLQTSPILFNFI